jgi:polyisoprenoid-binding protein YceI
LDAAELRFAAQQIDRLRHRRWNQTHGLQVIRMTLLTLLLACALTPVKGDTLVLDTAASVVKWKGTKFFGLGKHEGIVRLSEGYLALLDNRVDGRFVVNMHSIEVTDIPPDDPVPRSRLRRHLMDEDFFAVEQFPTAVFAVRRIQRTNGSTGYRVAGELTMRGVTHPISVDVATEQWVGGLTRATSQFRIDRHKWGVSFRGSRLTNDLVDDDIHFTLEFVLRSKRPVQ